MSSKKQLSGAQKRKLKREKFETAVKISKPITDLNFFTVPENVTLHVDQSELQEQPLPTEARLAEGRAELLSSRGSNSTSANSSEPEPNEVEDGARAVELSHSKDVVTDNTSCHYAGDTENENHLLLSTDRGSYSSETSQPTTDIRDFILQYGPFQPDTHFPENAQGRQFSAIYYNLKTKTGLDIRRKWLCYSLQLDKAYCETCWLFASRSSPQFRPEWILGVSDWQHLSQKISRHETSLSHIQAMRDRMNYEENRSIKSALNEETAREADNWRQVLKRIFKIIISLASSNNPLRGHTEKLDDPNPGNFLREVKLLAEFDPVLKELIYDKRQKVKYLGHEIQNEIIQTVSTAVKLEICEEIRKARYFSIVLDSTTDISKREQVSFVLRYCQFDEPNFTIVTKESFLGFFDLDNRSAKGYEKLLMCILKDLQLDFAFCRGQGYDGASVMSGEHNGLQANLQKLNPLALYVHCSAHKLNLVLTDGVKFKATMTEFFNVVQAVYKFFHASGIRWNELEIVCREGGLDKTQTSSITLKPVCETRWEARHASVLAIKARYIDLLKALSKIILVSKKTEEVAEATGIKKRLENFQFIIILVFWEKILRSFNLLSKKLQTVDVALDECVVMWQNGIQSLQDLEKNLLSVQDEAKEIASKWGVPAAFSSSRVVKKTRFFDGIGIDTARRTIMSEESLFEATLRPVIVNVIFQIKARFECTHSIFELFSFLTPSKILKLPENELSVKVNRFCLQYSNDVSTNLFGELLNLKVAMSSELCKIEKISDILKLLMRSNLRESFPNVVTSCVLYLTLPVSVASAERSFSKLKLIKNYLRSRMSQERLSGMALLSIEGKRAQALDIDSLIETFAKNKARRRPI